jgi:hypothetical protein
VVRKKRHVYPLWVSSGSPLGPKTHIDIYYHDTICHFLFI